MARLADAELDAAGGRDLAAFFNRFGRKDIDDGHARVRNALFARFGKIQHGLIGAGESGLCYTVIYLFVRCIETDGNGIKQPCQFWYDVAAVFYAAKAVRIETKAEPWMEAAYITSRLFQESKSTGRFPVATKNEFLKTSEIKGINGFFDLVPGRVYFVPQGGCVTNAVVLEADTEGTAAVALVREVDVDTALIRVENLSHDGSHSFPKEEILLP